MRNAFITHKVTRNHTLHYNMVCSGKSRKIIKTTKYMEIGERVEFDVWLLGRTFTFLDLSLQEGFQLEQCSGSPQGRENDLPD